MAGIKAGLEIHASNEQGAQAKLTESQDQLRVEQAKLCGLQNQLDGLEKQLEDSTRQTGSNPH